METIAIEKRHVQDSEHDNNDLIEIYINDGVNSLYRGFYAECPNISSLIISNGVKQIYGWVCSRCQELAFISMPDSIRYIGPCAFSRCNKLTTITIPKSVECIGNNAFSYCKNLTSVSFCGAKLGNSIFRGCLKITSVFVGENVQEIEPEIFSSCKNIKSLVVDENNKYFDSRNNCNAIIETSSNTLVLGCNTSKVPYGVKSISKRAFSDCGRMKKISLPDTLESIGSLPSSIQKIFIPKGSMDKFRQLLPRKKSKLIEI
jgi:hypothetical protein